MHYHLQYGVFQATLVLDVKHGAYEARIQPLQGNPSILLESWMNTPEMLPKLYRLRPEERHDALTLQQKVREYQTYIGKAWEIESRHTYSDINVRTLLTMSFLKCCGWEEDATVTIIPSDTPSIGTFLYYPEDHYIEDGNAPQIPWGSTPLVTMPWMIMHDHLPYLLPFMEQWTNHYKVWGDALATTFPMAWVGAKAEWPLLDRWLKKNIESTTAEEILWW